MTAILAKDVGRQFMEDWDIATAKCAVKDCENHKHQGLFVGLLCSPCHTFVSGDGGLYSQAYRNSRAMIDLAIQMERDRNTKLLYQMHERAAAHHNYYKHAAIEINRIPE